MKLRSKKPTKAPSKTGKTTKKSAKSPKEAPAKKTALKKVDKNPETFAICVHLPIAMNDLVDDLRKRANALGLGPKSKKDVVISALEAYLPRLQKEIERKEARRQRKPLKSPKKR